MMKLSVIIPAYNEEKNIGLTLKRVEKSLKHFNFPFEVIVVCDGCEDKTFEKAKAVAGLTTRVLEYQPNHGKGYALRFGFDHAKGDLIAFFDAGGDFHPDHIDRFIKLMEALEAEIVIGSKRHPMSRINYPTIRRFYSTLYQYLIRLLFGLKIRDTQTGLKIFKRQVLENILPRVLIKQYAFDLELLVLANHLGHHRITEAPVNMEFNVKGSGINKKTIFYMLVDTAAIFYRLKILRWYDREIE